MQVSITHIWEMGEGRVVKGVGGRGGERERRKGGEGCLDGRKHVHGVEVKAVRGSLPGGWPLG